MSASLLIPALSALLAATTPAADPAPAACDAAGCPAAACDPAACADVAKKSLIYVDHRDSDASRIPDAIITGIVATPVALGHPPADTSLASGLAELAKAQPRLSLRQANAPEATWYRQGGLGAYQVGAFNRAPDRMDSFSDRLNRQQIGKNVAVAQVQLAPQDLPSGQRVESGYVQYSATMDINFTSANLESTFIENLTAVRIVGGGGGTGGGVAFFSSYPLELPNVALSHISTTTRVPVGLATPEPGAVQGANGSGGGVAAANPDEWPRNPRYAFTKYRDSMLALEKANPSTTFVWSTMPITVAENAQRTWFNMQVRTFAVANSKVVFDIAAIQSHDAKGTPQFDSQGEVLAADYVATGSRSDLNAVGRQKIAGAWWNLMAKMKGWKPEAPAPASADPAALPFGH